MINSHQQYTSVPSSPHTLYYIVVPLFWAISMNHGLTNRDVHAEFSCIAVAYLVSNCRINLKSPYIFCCCMWPCQVCFICLVVNKYFLNYFLVWLELINIFWSWMRDYGYVGQCFYSDSSSVFTSDLHRATISMCVMSYVHANIYSIFCTSSHAYSSSDACISRNMFKL